MNTTWNRLASISLILFTTCTLRAASYYLESMGGVDGPPYPFDPSYGSAPLSEIGPDKYLVEDDDSESLQSGSRMTMNSINPTDPPGTNTSNGLPTPPNIRNYAKYSQQIFSLLDTNNLAAGDTNLYNACAGMAVDTNTTPTLQIRPYGPNTVIIKASHFDYSAEDVRDFTRPHKLPRNSTNRGYAAKTNGPVLVTRRTPGAGQFRAWQIYIMSLGTLGPSGLVSRKCLIPASMMTNY